MCAQFLADGQAECAATTMLVLLVLLVLLVVLVVLVLVVLVLLTAAATTAAATLLSSSSSRGPRTVSTIDAMLSLVLKIFGHVSGRSGRFSCA